MHGETVKFNSSVREVLQGRAGEPHVTWNENRAVTVLVNASTVETPARRNVGV